MSEFHNAIRWMQNGEIQLLFFIVGYSGDVDCFPEVEGLDEQTSRFYDYSKDSIYPVTLLEIRAKDGIRDQCEEVIIRRVFSELNDDAAIIICMFDGSYLSSEDLVDEENINHIYAWKSPEGEAYGSSDSLRHSDLWKSNVRAVQRQICLFLAKR